MGAGGRVALSYIQHRRPWRWGSGARSMGGIHCGYIAEEASVNRKLAGMRTSSPDRLANSLKSFFGIVANALTSDYRNTRQTLPWR